MGRIDAGRRRLLTSVLAGGAASLIGRVPLFAQAPGIVPAPGLRPVVTDGVASTLVDETTGLVWARADRAARLHVDWATTGRFEDLRTITGPAALEAGDYTARAYLPGLPRGQRVFYRVRFQDLADVRRWSEPAAGSFLTAPADAGRDVSLVFSADTVGQGWGLDPAYGGMQTYASMLGAQPDLFVNLGDAIYADQAVGLAVPLDGGGTWRSLPSLAKAKPAETVDEFRGNYRYNLTDAHMRRFNQSVAQLTVWDDHEVRDNWYPERRQDGDPRYGVASVALLAARAAQAHYEYTPMPLDGRDPERRYRSVRYGPIEVFLLDYRSYRGANSGNRQAEAGAATAHLGEAQVRWLEAALAASPATWKVMASSLPIGLVVGDGPDRFEAIANGDPGPPLGREFEIARLLRFIRDRRVDNVVWITGDVHYAAAHHYDPVRARFTDFTPFWEFVAGPLHAGTFGPNPLDPTFGPEVRFLGIPAGMKPNRPPSEGYQFFGRFVVDGATGALRASLHNRAGTGIFAVTLAPAGRV